MKHFCRDLPCRVLTNSAVKRAGTTASGSSRRNIFRQPAAAATSCRRTWSGELVTDTDTDTDTGSDTDTYTDSDTDSDKDSGSDTDTDIDTRVLVSYILYQLSFYRRSFLGYVSVLVPSLAFSP